jgi:hypothetical protein
MSDDIDRANDEVQNRLEETLSSIDVQEVPTNETGKCLWCEEPVENKKRWCSKECQTDHEYYANKL